MRWTYCGSIRAFRRSSSASSSWGPWRSTSFRRGERRLSEASISGVSVAPASEALRHRQATRWGFALLLPLLIVAMELAVSLIEPRVLSLRNIINILVQSSYLLLFASAQMVVILTGGFDLSLGMAVSVISVATALATTGLAAAGPRTWLILVAGRAGGRCVGGRGGI